MVAEDLIERNDRYDFENALREHWHAWERLALSTGPEIVLICQTCHQTTIFPGYAEASAFLNSAEPWCSRCDDERECL